MDDIWGHTVVRTGFSCTIALSGEIDMSVREAVLEVLLAEINRAGTTIATVDLAAVDFLDSSGLEALVKARHAADAVDCRMTVAGAKGAAMRVLEISDLLPFLTGGETAP